MVVAVNLLMIAAIIGILWLMIRSRVSGSRSLYAIGLAAALMMSWMQGSNLYNGFPGSLWISATLVPLAAFYCLWRSHEGWQSFSASAALGLAAPFTMSIGLLALPALALTSICLPVRIGQTAIFVFLGAATTAAFFSGFEFVARLTVEPASIAVFAIAVLGGPIFWVVFGWMVGVHHLTEIIAGKKWWLDIGGSVELYAGSAEVARVVAVLGGASFVCLSLHLFRRGWLARNRDPLECCLVGFLVFVIGVAFAIAVGRSGFGLQFAFQENYQTLMLVGWIVLALAIFGKIRVSERRATAAAVIVGLALLPVGLRGLKSNEQHYARLSAALAAVEQGSASPEQLAALGESTALVQSIVERYRRAGQQLPR